MCCIPEPKWAAVNVCLHRACRTAGSTGAGITMSLKNKLSSCSCLMLGSPELKSRLREAVSPPCLARAHRPHVLRDWGHQHRAGQGLSTRLGTVLAQRRDGQEDVLHPPTSRGAWAGLRTCSFSFLQLAEHRCSLSGFVQVLRSRPSSHQLCEVRLWGSGFTMSVIHRKCRFNWFWWNDSNTKATGLQQHHLLSSLNEILARLLSWQ